MSEIRMTSQVAAGHDGIAAVNERIIRVIKAAANKFNGPCFIYKIKVLPYV